MFEPDGSSTIGVEELKDSLLYLLKQGITKA